MTETETEKKTRKPRNVQTDSQRKDTMHTYTILSVSPLRLLTRINADEFGVGTSSGNVNFWADGECVAAFPWAAVHIIREDAEAEDDVHIIREDAEAEDDVHSDA